MHKNIKNTRYILEYIFVKFIIVIILIIGYKKSSNLGSFLFRKIGKLHSSHKLAKKNIKNSFSNLTEIDINSILDKMWDNIGRTLFECVHINKFNKKDFQKYVEIDENSIRIIQKIKNNNKAVIFHGAHIGNWELIPSYIKEVFDIDMNCVYRPMNNRFLNKIINNIRLPNMIPKNNQGNKIIIKKIRNNQHIAVVNDQKDRKGKVIIFLGRKALTNTSVAKLAVKYNIPIVPIKTIRLNNFKFKIEINDIIQHNINYTSFEDEILFLTKSVNRVLEQWITQNISQWFWVHNRWKL